MKKILLLIFCLVALQSKAQIYQPYPTENDKPNHLAKLLSLHPESTKKLSLKKLKLTKVPKELFRFKNLEELDLSGNDFVQIPTEIGSLTELKILKLANNSLKTLPNELKNLQKLTILDVSYNLIEKFPIVITQLTNLETLNIGGNRLLSIPDEIGNLSNLRTLYCPFNSLTKLPKSVGKLQNLSTIQANNNSLKSIPKEVEQMEKLMYLMLYNNDLSSLPAEIGKVKSLRELDISKNSFIEIPIEIKDDMGLRTFYLKRKDAQIPNIPDEVLAHIRDNQIKTDIGELDIKRMLTDLARREQDKKRLIESENEKIRLQAEESRKGRELAEAKAKNAENERMLAEERTRAEQERSALQQAEAESKRLKLEKEKEKTELEAKIAQERAAQETEAAAKEREANAKERTANAEIKKQQDKARKADEEVRRQTEKLNNTIVSAAIGALLFALIFIIYVLNSNRKVKQKQKEAELQRAKADKLLLNILPIQVATELKDKGVTEVKHFENASILFADVKGFSALASKVTPQELIKELDITFGKFDDVIMQYGLERIKTIGDCYMCVGGVPNPDPANIVYMIAASLEIQNWMADEHIRRNGEFWQVRLGVHIGSLVAGVIGKTKFAYDVWGHAVNTASRMESGGEVSRVNISVDTYHRIKDFFICTYRGQIEAKNIGLVDTYFVDAIIPELSVNGEGRLPNEEFKKRAKKILAS